MEKRRILNIFRDFHGSASWAARTLNVSVATVSRWMHGTLTSENLDNEMPKLAAKLIATKGQCINDVDGKSVRSKVGRLRRKGKK